MGLESAHKEAKGNITTIKMDTHSTITPPIITTINTLSFFCYPQIINLSNFISYNDINKNSYKEN